MLRHHYVSKFLILLCFLMMSKNTLFLASASFIKVEALITKIEIFRQLFKTGKIGDYVAYRGFSVFALNIVLLVLVCISLQVWHFIEPKPFHNFVENPILWFFPLLTFVGILGLFKVRSFQKDGYGFMFSTFFSLLLSFIFT